MSLPVENYKKLLLASTLLSQQQLSKTLETLAAEQPGRAVDTPTLSQRLLDTDLITPWQNGKLVKGCSRGFFIGRYRLLAHLGTGGMSRVYLAVHTMMKRRVAIKVLNQKLTESPSHLERFLRESQAAAALDHVNVVRAFDVDCDRNLYYFVMEYVEGPTLQQLVEKKGPLAYEYAADYIRQACTGLQHAHDYGLVHRDIKPGNLLLNPQGVVKILDLGMVRLTHSEVRSITIQFNESMLGTADYLAPEQALDSHNVDNRADLYAMGCTLYFLLTGQPPFSDGSMAMRLMRHQSEEAKAISTFRPDCPPELEQILRKMMAKQREKRYQSAAEVANDLAQWLKDRRSPIARSALNESVSGTDEDTVTGMALQTVVEQARRHALSESQKPVLDESDASAVLPRNESGALPYGESTLAPQTALDQPSSLSGDRSSLVEVQKPFNPNEGGAAFAPPAVNRPADINEWKFRDYELALQEGDPKFVQAVQSLVRRFPGSDKIVAFLVRLVTSPVLSEQPVNRQLLGTVVFVLAQLNNKAALKTLMRIVVGAVNLGPNDALAVSLCLDALARFPSPEGEQFLLQVLTNAEEARPAGKSAVSPQALRQQTGKVLQGRISSRLRMQLEQRLGYRSLHPQARQIIEGLLARPTAATT